MHFIARAITPPQRPKRFDTRFFALDASHIAKRLEGFVHADAELVELAWIGLKEAETLDLPPITLRVLAELRQRLDGGLSFFTPAPFSTSFTANGGATNFSAQAASGAYASGHAKPRLPSARKSWPIRLMFSAFDSPTRKKLAAAISCISIVGVGLSLVIPLLALRLEAAGYPGPRQRPAYRGHRPRYAHRRAADALARPQTSA